MKQLFFFALVFLPAMARADIFDRINACESAGGGKCVFDLLRELASQTGTSAISGFGGTYYRQGPNTAFCESHSNVPDLDGLGLKGFTMTCLSYNAYYSCAGNTCRAPDGYVVSLINADSYFITRNGDSATFKRTP